MKKKLLLFSILFFSPSLIYSQTTYTLAPYIGPYLDDNGILLSGGKIYTYIAGTSTSVVTHSNSSGTNNTNPVILDQFGRASIYLSSAQCYKFIIKTSADVDVKTQDNICGYYPVSGGNILGVPRINSTNPQLELYESDGATDAKLWDFDTNGGVLSIRTRTDADAVGGTVLAITRSGTSITGVDISQPATLSGSTTTISSTTTTLSGTNTISGATTFTSTAKFGSTGSTITAHYSGTASLNFAAFAGTDCQDLTITVTGAADGNTVSLGIPTALASTAVTQWTGFVSAANTVTVRGCKISAGASADPAAATVRADVWAH